MKKQICYNDFGDFMKCYLCPRQCGAQRESGKLGFCSAPKNIKVARAAVHNWEEPCISGTQGSGTVFFSGCPLKCVYCQNRKISAECFGKEISRDELKEIFYKIKDKGVHNLNLVSPTQYADEIAQILEGGFPIPVVYNTGGYESVKTLKNLEGKIQIYLPDIKYLSSGLAARYSAAADYPKIVKAAVLEMYRQVGSCKFDDNGIMQSGVLIRHLMLPGQIENTFDVIDWVHDNFPRGAVMFSLMSQYFPCGDMDKYPELNRKISPEEYSRAQEYMLTLGMDSGYFQEPDSADEIYVPDFDLTGIIQI
jgi:putative pyruvate formate lyase activating enzyme